MHPQIPKISAVLSALALLAGCQAEKTNVQLRNMRGSPSVMVPKQSRLRLANGQVFDPTLGVQATAQSEPIVRLAPVGGADQCFALRLAEVPADYYSKGLPWRLGM